MDPVVSNSREMIRKGSRSFALASRLFDRATRNDTWLLYAWCRHCDDVIDGQELGMTPAVQPLHDRATTLATLRAETRRALAGEAVSEPAFVALQRVARAHAIPERCALDMLDGFAMDVTGFRYRAFDDTLLYCYRVAGVVGVMMAMVMGVRDRRVLQRAADLGIAFQLTNIARDVLDDARNGRCYLPADWLAEAGVDAGDVAAPGQRAAVAAVVSRLLAEADRYYQSAGGGFRALGFRAAWAIATARGVYRDIGRVVRERGPEAWDSRAVVGPARKLLLLVGGALQALRAVAWDRRQPLAPRDSGLWVVPDQGAGGAPSTSSSHSPAGPTVTAVRRPS